MISIRPLTRPGQELGQSAAKYGEEAVAFSYKVLSVGTACLLYRTGPWFRVHCSCCIWHH